MDDHEVDSVLGMSVIASCFFTLVSVITKFPLPLDAALSPFLYGYLFNSKTPRYTALIQNILLTYLVMPIISGCLTWCIYRILIRGVMFVDEEDKFRRTLSWCGLIYPLALATCVTVISLKYFLSSSAFAIRHLLAHCILFLSFALCYALFKVLIRAWLKRRAFLLYPQEYALYMERSEKVEQGDREARGLGPIRDYYLPKASAASSSVTKQSQSILENSATITLPSVISPAVVAGKLAITAKRSEELFRPILNIISIVTLFISVPFESQNVFSILKRVTTSYLSPTILLWTVLLAIIPGCLVLSQRFANFLGRNIINEMRFSQAFAIQMGTLFTITLGLLLQSTPLAPSWYLLFSIAAVSSSQSRPQTQSQNGTEGNNAPNFRYKIRLILFFWSCSILFSGIMGALFCHYNKH